MVTRDEQVARQAHLHRGIYPVHYGGVCLSIYSLVAVSWFIYLFAYQISEPKNREWPIDMDNRINHALSLGRTWGYLNPHEVVVLVTGWQAGSGFTNTMRLIQVCNSRTPCMCEGDRRRNVYTYI